MNECIVELYKHVGIFKNMREVLKKHELQVNASCASRVFFKNPKCLYNSTMYDEQDFYFFYKMYCEFHVLVLICRLGALYLDSALV